VTNKIILMYHSVSSEQVPSVLGSFPIPFERFQRQIKLIQQAGYRFDFISNLHKDIPSHERVVYITGDDGTIDWTRNILPWCEKEKIPTHTGIITGVFEEPKVYPLTHLIQIILITRDENELSQLSKKIINKYLTQEQLEYINQIYYYENLEYRRIIKGAFNLILESETIYKLIGKLSHQEDILINERFESLEFYKQFKYAQVGVHTRSHWALDKDSQKYIKDEIISSKNILEKSGLNLSKFFVSPMKPKHGASLKDIEQSLKELGFEGILDSNFAIWNQRDYIIPRIDAKDVEGYFKDE